jgi:hypothetical protein
MITVKQHLDYRELLELIWQCGYTIDKIEEHNVIDEFMDLLDTVFDDNEKNPPTLTELNDFIRFETDFIFEALGIGEEE